ncbi:hypothetical protein PV11_01054 [Exophiala sideris]|uniref:Uncharacterized protein n=1 Tax=Exophiala sideris TaxID=1016849 RepID=A0A0D1ZF05_9EURO|nr:hypothetical protein PV11_01054 [Exophiala sideris]
MFRKEKYSARESRNLDPRFPTASYALSMIMLSLYSRVLAYQAALNHFDNRPIVSVEAGHCHKASSQHYVKLGGELISIRGYANLNDAIDYGRYILPQVRADLPDLEKKSEHVANGSNGSSVVVR